MQVVRRPVLDEYVCVMERVPYYEFAYFAENAAEFGLPYHGQPDVRRIETAVDATRKLSALHWGTARPGLVLLHGGAQNAHTWDTVALAIDRPLLAINLPGHGHSDGPSPAVAGGQLSPIGNADDVAAVIRARCAAPVDLVGMSLGGLTALAVAANHPVLVRSLTMVDVTPGVDGEKAQAITAFVNGPTSFPSFAEILARTIEFNPTRSESSLRRGILHNAEQQVDGSWVWRYRRFDVAHTVTDEFGHPQFESLWDLYDSLSMPLMLVRGMRSGSVVNDADEAEVRRRVPTARIEHVAEAGHSIQGDDPVALAQLIADFTAAR